jgi:hypothetical protein
MRRECYSLLPSGTMGLEVPVGSPDLTDRKQAVVAVSSEEVTTRAATVITPGGAAVFTNREKCNR